MFIPYWPSMGPSMTMEMFYFREQGVNQGFQSHVRGIVYHSERLKILESLSTTSCKIVIYYLFTCNILRKVFIGISTFENVIINYSTTLFNRNELFTGILK